MRARISKRPRPTRDAAPRQFSQAAPLRGAGICAPDPHRRPADAPQEATRLRSPPAATPPPPASPGRGLVQRIPHQILPRLPPDGPHRRGEHQHLLMLVRRRPPPVGDLKRLVRLPPRHRSPAARVRLEHGVQLPRREQHRPPVQHRRHGGQLRERHEALLDQQRQEVVAGAERAGPGDRGGRLDHQGGVQLALDQHQPAGHPQHGLLGHEVGGLLRLPDVLRLPAVLRLMPLRNLLLRLRAPGADGPHGSLELFLGDLDDLRRQAGGVGEGEHGGLVADEQDGAGALLLRVARGTAGGAVVTARGGLSGEQAGCFFVADLGAYLVADVEHARHGWLPRDAVRGEAGWLPARGPGGSPAHEEDNGRSVAGVTPYGERNRTIQRAGSPSVRNPALNVNSPRAQGV